MGSELSVLLITAASIGFFHTLFGPDHYLPFIVMAKSGRWSLRKTAFITFCCGLGHVLSSVVLGLIGVACGIAVNNLVEVESYRGDIAAWALIAFGFTYFAWVFARLSETVHTNTFTPTEPGRPTNIPTRTTPNTYTPMLKRAAKA